MMQLRRLPAGYTLIEILIVLFIISIVTSVGLLSIGHNENKRMETFANEVTQMVTLAEEHAMLQPNVLGLEIGDQQLQFSSLQQTADDKKAKWIPLQDNVLGKHAIPHNIEVNVEVGKTQVADKDKTDNPQIVISTSGDITPFTIYIGKKGEKPSYAIIGDADGNVTNKYLS